MTARKPGLPICQHIALGGQLQAIRDQLLHASVALGNAYPKGSKAARQAEKALHAVDELRNVLDSASADEHPEDQWTPSVYYGGDTEMRERDMAGILRRHQAGNPPCCAGGEENA
jgi:hypothetical protein